MPDPTPAGPWLEPYRDLKGRSARRDPFPWAICEGAYLVESALAEARSGRLRVVSVLVPEGLEGPWAGRLAPGTALIPLSGPELQALVGFPFHRGVLACVEPPPERPLADLQACSRLLVLPRVDQEENLGEMSAMLTTGQLHIEVFQSAHNFMIFLIFAAIFILLNLTAHNKGFA